MLRMFGPKREYVTRSWRKLHSEKLHNLYPLPDIIRVMILRRMSWLGHVTYKGGLNENLKNFLPANLVQIGLVQFCHFST
jgi:hypothetical protein